MSSAELQQDLQNAQSMAKEVPELATIVLKFLLAPQTYDFQSALGEFAGKYETIEAPVLKSATRGVIVLYQAAIEQKTPNVDFSRLTSGFNLNNNLLLPLQRTWEIHAAPYISGPNANRSNQHSNTITQTNQLLDLDWNFGVTAFTDECQQVGKTFVQLKLTISTEHGVKDVLMELTVEQFYQFLSQMEKCKSYLDLILSS